MENNDYNNHHEEENIIEKAKSVVTISQMVIGFIVTIVTVAFFFFQIQNEANRANDNNVDQDRAIEEIRAGNKERDMKIEANQRETINSLNDIKLMLKDKQDRK